MTPPDAGSSTRNFENTQNFPIFQFSEDSCGSQSGEPTFFLRTTKRQSTDGGMIFPEDIEQAGDQATIYDQNGNVVYYAVQFDRGLCNAQATGNLPTGTTEIKTAWRVIDSSEASRYFTTEATIEGGPSGTALLGLIGFHLARSTALHPEMVWATFEHKDNARDCFNPQATPSAGWSFTSSTCAQCLTMNGPAGCQECNFNQAQKASALTGTPTEICRVYHDGTRSGDNQSATNIQDIDDLNDQLVGVSGILTQLPASNPMAVLANYINVGAIWENDVTQPSSVTENLRGSIQLANTVAETTFQGTLPTTTGGSPGTATNCFSCHKYTPDQTATSDLSHIFSKIHGTTAKK